MIKLNKKHFSKNIIKTNMCILVTYLELCLISVHRKNIGRVNVIYLYIYYKNFKTSTIYMTVNG